MITISFIRVASIQMLAICFYNLPAFTQTSVTGKLLKETRAYPCESQENSYLDVNDPNNHIWYEPLDSSVRPEIKKVRFKGENLKIQKSYADFGAIVTPKKAGQATLIVKLTTTDKSKFIITKTYTAVELPVPDVEIAVTDPASKFMWLNLVETATRQNVNNSFTLCKIEFELADKTGKLKEYGISCKGDDFFPSVTLHNLPSLFELNDVLKLNIVVMHREYDLPVYIRKELIIEKLWH